MFPDHSTSSPPPSDYVGPFDRVEAFCACLAAAIAARAREVGADNSSTVPGGADACTRVDEGAGAHLANAAAPVLEGTMLALSEDASGTSEAVWVPALRTARGWWVARPGLGFTQPSSGTGRTSTEVAAFGVEDIVAAAPGREVVIRTTSNVYELADDGYDWHTNELTVCSVEASEAIHCALFHLGEYSVVGRREVPSWRATIRFDGHDAVVSLTRSRRRASGDDACEYTDGQRIPLPFGH